MSKNCTLYNTDELIETRDKQLFKSICCSNHCLRHFVAQSGTRHGLGGAIHITCSLCEEIPL